MMKRFVLALAGLVLFGALAEAEISLKSLGNDQVSITFTYLDKNAAEMGVIGSFNNWTVPGEAMTKNAAGLWEKTIEATAADEIVYKFYSAGSWIPDPQAPDTKDDGYGGKNGLIVVADILSGKTPMVPGGQAVVMAPVKKSSVAPRKKVTFGTDTILENETAFDTSGASFKPTSNTIHSKSVWTFDGDLVNKVPGTIKITLYEGDPVLWSTSKTLKTGMEDLATGALFGPLYYLGGNTRPVLNDLKFGIDLPWLSYETGYLQATLPEHTSVDWVTISDSNEANKGYSLFQLGKKLREAGDFSFDLALLAHQSLDSHYGYEGWASAGFGGFRFEGQYGAEASTQDTPSQMFDDPIRREIVVGAEQYLAGGLSFKGQALLTRYTEGGVSDARPLADRMAYKAAVAWKDPSENGSWTLSYQTRGDLAQLLFADNDDVLGTAGTSKAALSAETKFGYWATLGADVSSTAAVADGWSTDASLSVKPTFTVDFAKLELPPVVATVFALYEANQLTAAGDVTKAGARVQSGPADLRYQYDETTAHYVLQSLLSELKAPGGLVVQSGLAYRTGRDAVSTYGALVGLAWSPDASDDHAPVVWVQALANLDPYTGDAPSAFELSDFGPDNGASGSDGVGALRVGARWSY